MNLEAAFDQLLPMMRFDLIESESVFLNLEWANGRHFA